jgi:regulator of replication initiation timing
MTYTGIFDDIDLSHKFRKLKKRIKELNNSLSIALEVNDKYQRENEKLKGDLARAKEDHQYDNLVHKKELESLRKK